MSALDGNRPSVLVCQRGARHRYAIPRLLEDAGMLAALYTDSSVYSLAGTTACHMKKIGISFGQARALTGRIPQGIPRQKIFSSDKLLISSLIGRRNANLSSQYMKWGLQNANVVYSMYGADLAFLMWAKNQSAKIIADVFISPLTNQLLFDEQVRFKVPDQYRVKQSDCTCSIERGIGAYAHMVDVLLCPSSWVAEGVRKFVPNEAGKIRVIPYGSSILSKKQAGGDVGRILFAGRDPLRKGLVYLAKAVCDLRKAGLQLDVRIAGLRANECSWIPHYEELNFLGKVDMDRMGAEYERADVFVLPSLSEGQAGVVLEALSHGCPVIATRECGVDFSPAENGILVDARSSSQLRDAIWEIVSNRPFRNRIARNGKQFFEDEFSMGIWERRLTQLMNEMLA